MLEERWFRISEIKKVTIRGSKPQDIGGKHYDHADLEEIRAAVDVYGAWIKKAYRDTKRKNRDTDVTQAEKQAVSKMYDLPQVHDTVKIMQTSAGSSGG